MLCTHHLTQSELLDYSGSWSSVFLMLMPPICSVGGHTMPSISGKFYAPNPVRLIHPPCSSIVKSQLRDSKA